MCSILGRSTDSATKFWAGQDVLPPGDEEYGFDNYIVKGTAMQQGAYNALAEKISSVFREVATETAAKLDKLSMWAIAVFGIIGIGIYFSKSDQ